MCKVLPAIPESDSWASGEKWTLLLSSSCELKIILLQESYAWRLLSLVRTRLYRAERLAFITPIFWLAWHPGIYTGLEGPHYDERKWTPR